MDLEDFVVDLEDLEYFEDLEVGFVEDLVLGSYWYAGSGKGMLAGSANAIAYTSL